MDLGIRNKVALVTGGGRNLGRYVAEELVTEGCKVFVSAKTSESVAKAVSELRAIGGTVDGAAADLTVKADVVRLFTSVTESFGSPDILIYNNAGPPNPFFEDATDQDYLEGFATTIMGFVWCVQQAVPGMKSKKWGRIVTLGSIAAREPHNIAPVVLHNLLRPAAQGLSKTLSNQLGAYGITINTIGTGRIDTKDEQGAFRRTYREASQRTGIPMADLLARAVSNIPVGRAGHPTEVAALCAFLCSERSSFINGQIVMCDGGQVNIL